MKYNMIHSDLAVWNVSKHVVDTGSKKNANKIIFTTILQIKLNMLRG